jgi:hypothetical protein
MNKICTSVEQSKKLIKLGIDINTSDMRYGYIAPYDFSDRMYDGGYDEVPYPKDFLLKNPNFSANEYDGELPAWSLSSLLQLIPPGNILLHDTLNGKYKCINTVDSSYYDNPLDAAFEMVIWLKENRKI